MTSNPKTLHIFGGGEYVSTAEAIAREFGLHVVIRTGSRFAGSFGELSPKTEIYIDDKLTSVLAQGPQPSGQDIGLSFSAPWIFKQDVIDLFPGGMFNLHSQNLPKFRGAGGASWNILMRDKQGGCCMHYLTTKVDAGEIITRERYQFPDDCIYPKDFDHHSIKIAKGMLERWLRNFLETGKTPEPELVDENDSEYWPRLNTMAHGWLDWSWSLRDIQVFVQAFSYPHPGSMTELGQRIFHILDVDIVVEPGKFHPFQTGLIYRKDQDNTLYVAHKDGTLIIKDYKVADYSPRLGDRLYTSSEVMDKSRTRRIQYTPSGQLIDV